jgi:hypothetical protein
MFISSCEESPEDLEATKAQNIAPTVVLPRLSQSDEAAFSWVRDQKRRRNNGNECIIQTTFLINFRPTISVPRALNHARFQPHACDFVVSRDDAHFMEIFSRPTNRALHPGVSA